MPDMMWESSDPSIKSSLILVNDPLSVLPVVDDLAIFDKSIFFDMDDGDVEQFDKLPQWMQDKIKGGLDFNDTGLAKALVGVDKVEYEATTAPIEDMVSDSPY